MTPEAQETSASKGKRMNDVALPSGYAEMLGSLKAQLR